MRARSRHGARATARRARPHAKLLAPAAHPHSHDWPPSSQASRQSRGPALNALGSRHPLELRAARLGNASTHGTCRAALRATLGRGFGDWAGEGRKGSRGRAKWRRAWRLGACANE
eukprot:3353689-Pyramimonas_sp.AAC.1